LVGPRLRHWLLEPGLFPGYDGHLSKVLSVERDPSPDGVTSGQVTWYDYAGKRVPEEMGTNSLPSFVAQVLPDGTTHFDQLTRNSFSKPTAVVSTWTQSDGSVGIRTNSFAYSSDGIDLIKWINPLSLQVSSNLYNSVHQVATNYNALNEMTVYKYDSLHRLTNTAYASGLVVSNAYHGADSNTNNIGRWGFLPS
jgi:hypothetical protein